VEQEEEYITNTLVKKLEQVRREKVDLENQLEQEEEFITNKLQKQLLTVVNEKRYTHIPFQQRNLYFKKKKKSSVKLGYS
jgi:hypothetical protein